MELLGKTGNENVYRALDYYSTKFNKRYAIIGKLPEGTSGADKDKFLIYDLATSTLAVVERNNKADKYSLYNIARRKEAINFGLTDGEHVSVDCASKLGLFWGPASTENKFYIIAETTECFGVVSFLIGCSAGLTDIWYDFGNVLNCVSNGYVSNAVVEGNNIVVSNSLHLNNKGEMVKALSKKFRIC